MLYLMSLKNYVVTMKTDSTNCSLIVFLFRALIKVLSKPLLISSYFNPFLNRLWTSGEFNVGVRQVFEPSLQVQV